MIIKLDLTKPQAEKLFWAVRDLRKQSDVGPLPRALEALTEVLEEKLSEESDE